MMLPTDNEDDYNDDNDDNSNLIWNDIPQQNTTTKWSNSYTNNNQS